MNKGFLIAVCLCIASIIGLSCKNRSAEPHITGNTVPGTPVISYEDFKLLVKETWENQGEDFSDEKLDSLIEENREFKSEAQ